MSVYRVARAVVLSPCKVLFRVRVRGVEKVPRAGAYVLAPSHRSILDIPFAAFVTRRRIRFMGKKELWESRFGARAWTALGGFPVERGTADRSALRSAREVLEAGEPLAVFPEGTRQRGPEIQKLFEGACYLAARARVPVVPIGIGGSEEILASGRSIPRLRRVAVVVGDPILPPDHEGPARRSEIAAMTRRLHGELQGLFDEARALAGYRAGS